jgi:hypothetical protein
LNVCRRCLWRRLGSLVTILGFARLEIALFLCIVTPAGLSPANIRHAPEDNRQKI